MKKYYRIEVFRDYVQLFRLKQDGITTDQASWEHIAIWKNLNSCFFANSEFKPSDFRIVGDKFTPVTLQNF